MVTVALYARVSSTTQVLSNTIESQVADLENKITEDKYKILNELKFIDNGYSGSNLVRPALEKLRDKVSNGEIDKIYIHSPDRLSRKYAYQMIVLEELKKGGAEVVFLNHKIDENPESHLLLQMQGMIAEYERAKIMERMRRGTIHAAKRGSINALGKAPYGYRYINKHASGGEAQYEIIEEEAEIIRKIFIWVGNERLSLGGVVRRLGEMQISSPTKKVFWSRSSVGGILKNTAYKGQAAFGKTKNGTKIKKIRPQRNSKEQLQRNYSVCPTDKEDWIFITVPALIDERLFDTVQEQLEENKKTTRVRNKGASYLLQGLVVCGRCHYSFYGHGLGHSQIKKRGEIARNYVYYCCAGKISNRYGGRKMCNTKSIRVEALDVAVWEEVKVLLKDPVRLMKEYQRRILELDKSPTNQSRIFLEKQENKLQRGISRLIDAYAQEDIDKEEFEPRVKAMRQQLKKIEEQKYKITDHEKLKNELTLIVTNLENFSSSVESKLENIDWFTKRDIIRMLVRRIEINDEDINVVLRIKELPATGMQANRSKPENLQHCPASLSAKTH